MLGLRGRGKRRNRSISLVMAALLAGATSIFMFGGTASAQTSVIVSAPDTAIAGEDVQVCFDIVDDEGDPESIAASAVTYTVSPAGTSDDTSKPTAPAAYTSGDYCDDWNFETAGVKTITVSIAASDSSDVDNTSKPVKAGSTDITILPADAEVLYCITPASVTAGVPFQFTVWAADDFDNETTDVDSDLDIHFFVTPEDAANVLPGTTEWPAGASRVTLTATLWTSGAIMVFTDGDENLQDEDDPQLVCNGILVTTPAPASSGGAAAAAATTTTLPSFTG
jgi:hypothetical protein